MATSTRIDIERIAERARVSVRAATSFVIQDIAEEIVSKTPVRTGNLRANWVMGLNSVPDAGQARDPIAGSGTPAVDPAASAAISFALSDFQMGDTVYFVNNAPYARAVEYGTSRFEGRAMVRSTVARAPQIADEAVERVLAFKSSFGT